MYVRVNMVEFNSHEGMHEALTIWRKNAAQWMTGAQLLFTISLHLPVPGPLGNARATALAPL